MIINLYYKTCEQKKKKTIEVLNLCSEIYAKHIIFLVGSVMLIYKRNGPLLY